MRLVAGSARAGPPRSRRALRRESLAQAQGLGAGAPRPWQDPVGRDTLVRSSRPWVSAHEDQAVRGLDGGDTTNEAIPALRPEHGQRGPRASEALRAASRPTRSRRRVRTGRGRVWRGLSVSVGLRCCGRSTARRGARARRRGAVSLRRCSLALGCAAGSSARSWCLSRSSAVSPVPYNPFDFRAALQFWGVGGGLLAFDYGAATIRFGHGLEESEAKSFVAEMRSRGWNV